MIPAPPTNYTATLDPPSTVELAWVNGAGAVSVRHEISTDCGTTWARLDDDQAPTTASTHSLPAGTVCVLRAKSVNPSGESEYTPAVAVVSREYVP